MNILILSIVVFIALMLIKDGLDMCKTRAEVDMIYRMCKFLTVCYLDSKACVDINQGLDARLLTERKIEIIRKIRIKMYHFAWDNPADENKILPKLQMFSEMVKVRRYNTTVYCLVNFNSTLDEDLHRIYTIRQMKMQPYVMIYDKEHCDKIYNKLQRWVNAPALFWSTPRFEDYQ